MIETEFHPYEDVEHAITEQMSGLDWCLDVHLILLWNTMRAHDGNIWAPWKISKLRPGRGKNHPSHLEIFICSTTIKINKKKGREIEWEYLYCAIQLTSEL